MSLRGTLNLEDLIRSTRHHGYLPVLAGPAAGKTDLAVELITGWIEIEPERRHVVYTDEVEAYRCAFAGDEHVVVIPATDSDEGAIPEGPCTIWMDGLNDAAMARRAAAIVDVPTATLVVLARSAAELVGFPWGRIVLVGWHDEQGAQATVSALRPAVLMLSQERLQSLGREHFVLVGSTGRRRLFREPRFAAAA